VVDNTRGGGFEHFTALQKDHWREVLRDELNDTFDQGWRKAQIKYEDRLDDLNIQVNDLLD
jgi:hypothetical protein